MEQRLSALIERQRRHFRTGATLPVEARLSALRALRRAIVEHEDQILAALREDLGKPCAEAYTSEIAFLYLEIDHALKRLRRWMRPRLAAWDVAQFPGWGRVHREPYGVSLIVGPWNYPFQLLLAPLVGALAGGNTAILKPSEMAPATEVLSAKVIDQAFDPSHVAVVRGGAEVGRALLELPFDKVFFTGSTRVGREVMAAAARHLTPVTLELGGKNPVIVDADASLAIAARRIVWGKFLNAGQTCVAPDFVAVRRSEYPALVGALIHELRQRYGPDPRSSPKYGRILDRRNVRRLAGLLEGQRLLHGGAIDAEARYVAPTLIDAPDWDAPLMREEVFGPLLPLLPYDDLDALMERLRDLGTPLALYLFTRERRTVDRVRRGVPSGGLLVNGTVQHIVSPNLPFGGVGQSGMGDYHGRAGFEAFTRRRSELRLPAAVPATFADARRSPPLRWLRRLLR